MKLKGILGGFAAAMSTLSYVAYYFCNLSGISFDEPYFIVTGYGVAIFTGLLFTFFQNKIIRTLLLFCSVFYTILVSVYILHWMITGLPYAYIKISLLLGLLSGIVYFLHDVFTNIHLRH